jgi:hypothetical protein
MAGTGGNAAGAGGGLAGSGGGLAGANGGGSTGTGGVTGTGGGGSTGTGGSSTGAGGSSTGTGGGSAGAGGGLAGTGGSSTGTGGGLAGAGGGLAGTGGSTCTPGDACAPTNPCQASTGTIQCSGGTPACVAGNLAAGTTCGDNHVCDGAGSCIACTANAVCTPADVCHVGRTVCSNGAVECTDTYSPATDGTVCGSGTICINGSCDSVPSAPKNFSAVVNFGVATLTWNDPASTGGANVTGWVVGAVGGGQSLSTTTVTTIYQTPFIYKVIFEGLTDGAQYTFTVSAVNPVGTGPAATTQATLPCGSFGLPGRPLVDNTDNPVQLHNMVAADLNLDGKLDVLSPSTYDTTFLGHGDGSFSRGIQSDRYDDNQGVSVVGDFNKDGKLDILAAVNSGSFGPSLTARLGDGTGKFPTNRTAAPLPATPTAGGAADIDGDGRLDAVFGSGTSYTVLLGLGDGTFPQRADVPVGKSIEALALGDLNGDQKTDLVLAVGGLPTTTGSGLFVCLGNGDGTFQSPVTYGTPAYFNSVTQIALADLNGDGHLDAIATGDAASVSVLLGNGDGTLQGTQAYGTPCNNHSLLVTDVNADGRLDVVAGSTGTCPTSAGYGPSGFVHVLLGNGNGTLGTASVMAVPPLTDRGLAAGDFDGDGKIDLVVAPLNLPSFAVLKGLGTGAFVAPAQTGSSGQPTDIWTGSIAGGSTLDVLTYGWSVVSGANNIQMRLVDYPVAADGTLGAPQVTTGPAFTQQPFFMTVADLNGDGKPDVLAGEPAGAGGVGAFDVFVGQGNGGFIAGNRYTFVAGAQWQAPVLCDIDHDGKLDAVVNTGTQVSIFPGHGNGTFGLSYTLLQAQVTGGVIACADLDGDNYPELIVPDTHSQWQVAHGNGNFTFQTPVSYAARPGDGPVGTVPVLTDVNGDGKLDLAVQANGGVYALLGDGAGAFPTIKFTGFTDNDFSPQWGRNLTLADVDGDGKMDAIIASSEGSVGVMLGVGDGTFPYEIAFSAGGTSGPTSITSADLNGDGRKDIAVTVMSSQPVAVDVMFNRALSSCY